MAQTSFASNNSLTVKLWEKMLYVEALKATWMMRFVSEGSDNIWQLKDETRKSAGDQVTYGLRMQMTGGGTLGDGTLHGNEEALATFSDALVINQLRNSYLVNGRMSQQRVAFDIREEGLSGLRDWWSGRLDLSAFNQLCGNLGPTDIDGGGTVGDVRYTGCNAPIAPDAAHYFNASGPGGTDDTSLSSANIFTLALIDKCVEKAKTLTPAIRPIKVDGKEWFVLFLHPYAVTDFRAPGASAGTWYDINKAALTGGLISDNPIFTGALGVYNGVIIHESARVTQGYNPGTSAAISTVRRNVFCGAQAGAMAFGRDNTENKFTWAEQYFDYGNQCGIAAGLIFGMKKAVFNNKDFATIVCSSYAAAH